MANETIGKIEHHCGQSADVRKNKNGKMYLSCPHCGLLAYALTGGQNYILDNAVMYNGRGELPESVTDKKPIHNVTEKSRYETVVLEDSSYVEETVTEEKQEPIKQGHGIALMEL